MISHTTMSQPLIISPQDGPRRRVTEIQITAAK
jgi:hypothetical protein